MYRNFYKFVDKPNPLNVLVCCESSFMFDKIKEWIASQESNEDDLLIHKFLGLIISKDARYKIISLSDSNAVRGLRADQIIFYDIEISDSIMEYIIPITSCSNIPKEFQIQYIDL